MKFGLRNALVVAAFAIVAAGCKNKVDERIAALDKQPVEPAASTAQAAPIPPETKPEGPLPAFKFETSDHDFGAITEGDVVEYTYNFVNTGDAPLIIQGAQGTCGCTIPEWSKEPIPVGGKGFVKAKFNSSGKHGQQHKTVTITANTFPRQTQVNFTATVNQKAAK